MAPINERTLDKDDLFAEKVHLWLAPFQQKATQQPIPIQFNGLFFGLEAASWLKRFEDETARFMRHCLMKRCVLKKQIGIIGHEQMQNQ